MTGHVVSVSRDGEHRFAKEAAAQIRVRAGLGVEGDAHEGITVQHLSRVRRDPSQPNLRQVHLIHQELLEEARAAGFDISPGALGENILTVGIELLALPRDSRLQIGEAVLRVTGLRNPCHQIDEAYPGLLKLMVRRTAEGQIERRCGVMTVVEHDGFITTGDEIVVELPEHRAPLEPV